METLRGASVVIKNLEKLEKQFGKKALKEIQDKAAKLIVERAKQKVIVSKKPHVRKDENGNIIATYYSGNLKRSIGIVRLKKSNITWVGPRLSKSGGTGNFKGNRVDGYYGNFVEYNLGWGKKTQPYMRPAYDETKKEVINELFKGIEILFDRYKPNK